MQCKCCGTEITGAASMCPACAFPTLVHGNLDIDKEAESYRDSLIGKISLYIKSFSYTYNDENDSFGQSEEYTLIAEAKALETGVISWSEKEFIDIDPDRSVKLYFRVKNDDAKREIELPIEAGSALCRCRVGLVLKEGFMLSVAVGTPEKHVMSAPISLLNQ